ncbi:MAG: adenylate/guanylate cyclase domain-containing protein [Merismopedia sp. SIO2A8]|nr:adenylate/guanylate cyclase domain-containing protein [Symploca sp. SIO2B6]NET50420.1 adenylate/guanylate cyclase domain-containing protein [Merismopedia sp. SIO2A8]
MVSLESGPHLILRTETGKQFISLDGSNCWTIGRGDDNNFVLPDRWISRNHAMLQRMETGEFILIDLGSRNGTFVDGRRVSVPVTLQDGDNLTFGQTELEYVCPDSPPKSSDISSSEDPEPFTATAMLHVRRLISVLVIDIRNFTVMTQQLDEKVLSETIGTWFRCSGDIIREYGSYVDKYIGDAIMAVWMHGTDTVSRHEMLRVAEALSAIHKMTSQLHEKYPLPAPVRVGAGVNTGYAMVGNTGTGDRPDYTALGDTVNAAFRLESSTKQIKRDVAFGKNAYNYLMGQGDDILDVAEAKHILVPHTVHLKGYEKSTQAYACSFSDLDQFIRLSKAHHPNQEAR